MTIIWCMVPQIWSVTVRTVCHLGPFFALLPKNKNFEKMKKTLGDINILHMYTINDNCMIYGSWDMERDGQKYYYIELLFALFQKTKRPPRDIIILHMSNKHYDKWFTILPEIWCAKDRRADGKIDI